MLLSLDFYLWITSSSWTCWTWFWYILILCTLEVSLPMKSPFGGNTFLNLSQGDLTVNVSWAFSPINSPAPRPKITAAVVMLRRERSICVWETQSLGVEQFMYRNFLRVRCLRGSDRLIFVTVTWSTWDMVPYGILRVENIFSKCSRTWFLMKCLRGGLSNRGFGGIPHLWEGLLYGFLWDS